MRNRPVLRALLASSFATVVAASLAACDPGHGADRGQARWSNCSSCHGEDGSGNHAVGAPAIAGMPAWYVAAELEKFRTGARGAHPDDVGGLKMRAMARTLRTEEDVKAVADYVAKLRPVRTPTTVTDGNEAHGRDLFQPCIACHGPTAEGNEGSHAPNLRRADDWYLQAQLRKFRAGVRGTTASDTTGAQMRPMAMTLPDDQAVDDVVAYLQTLSR
jgi:cytochrome c553